MARWRNEAEATDEKKQEEMPPAAHRQACKVQSLWNRMRRLATSCLGDSQSQYALISIYLQEIIRGVKYRSIKFFFKIKLNNFLDTLILKIFF